MENSFSIEKKPIIFIKSIYAKERKIFNNKKLLIEKKNFNLLLFFLIFIIFIQIFIIIKKGNKDNNRYIKENNFFLDQYETHIYDRIKIKLLKNRCSQMWDNQREFLNGVIRKFRPKKILEIGTAEGGGTSIMLNAIQDIEDAHLYSIDLSSDENIGKCVRNIFPEFLNKWTLFQGDVAAKFMEQIGSNIDMVFIDSAHYEPGEILDFLIVLPFLKENAIVGFHDIGNQITRSNVRNEWAPYIIFNIIRGKKYLPSGNSRLKHDIGIKILDVDQNKYIQDYFRALGGQWQYFPKDRHIKLIYEFFKHYYDNDCLIMFNETVEFNRQFVKNNPKEVIYRSTID